MKKLGWMAGLLTALLALAGCQLLDNETSFGPRRGAVTRERARPVPPILSVVNKDTVIILTGVSFPKGYDWQRDTALGRVPCSLVVYAGTEKLLEVPVSDEAGVSADPDMHRWVDGHLYSDYASSAETLVARDGKVLFRYPGREMLSGFWVDGEDVYTLGQNRSGAGFSLRRNGRELLTEPAGYVQGNFYDAAFPGGALYKDGEDLCFSFFRLTGTHKTWFLVRNGTVEPVPVDSDLDPVMDVRRLGGHVCLVAGKAGVTASPVLVIDGERFPVGEDRPHQERNCRLAWNGERVYVKGEYLYAGGMLHCLISDRFGNRTGTRDNTKVIDFYLDKEEVAYVGTKGESTDVTDVNAGGRRYFPPGRYRLMTRACVCLRGRRLYMALTSSKGGAPVLWENGKQKELPFNGFLTGIDVTIR